MRDMPAHWSGALSVKLLPFNPGVLACPSSDLPLVIEPSLISRRAPRRAGADPGPDLTSAARYAEGHIPGARFVDPKRTQWGQPRHPACYRPRPTWKPCSARLGHRPEATYVVYDDEGGGWAGRFIWLLDVIGHHRYHYLNGGLPAWIADAQALDREVPAPVGGPPPLTLHDELSATREYLQSRLGAADLAVWDARNPSEYAGTKVLAAKAGHVPGAINFGWTAGMDPARALRIRARISPKSGGPSASRRTRK
ncbi:rhodanese-like domain-containing protein [Klebsiella pneumoniae]